MTKYLGRLEGRCAIVTGAASGIGKAISNLFAGEGAKVLAVDRDAELLAESFGNAEAIVPYEMDVMGSGAAETIIGVALEQFGKIEILVNNAGICPVVEIAETSDQIWNEVLDINLNAVFRLCRAAIPHLRANDWGRIVNTGSIMSEYGGAGLGAYVASKHAIAGLTKTLAAELGGSKITANYVQPGAIVTGITSELFDTDEDFRNFWTNKASAGRLGWPEDIAPVVLFLASEEARFISGEGILVDGGAMSHP